MDAVTGALIQLVSLCAFSAICELILSGGRLLSSVRFISGILSISVMVELLIAVVRSIAL